MSKEETVDIFNEASFYDASGDPEQLTCQDVWSALQEFLDWSWDGDGGMRQTIAKVSPVRVTAWNPKKLGKDLAEDIAERWVDELAENGEVLDHWIENYGNFNDSDGGPIGAITTKDGEELQKKLAEVLHPYIEKCADIYQCEQVASRDYTEAELLEMFKAEVEDTATPSDQPKQPHKPTDVAELRIEPEMPRLICTRGRSTPLREKV